ncbi:MAG: SpoIVB peptidase [Oscillospiraceae bacterium]|nr:SpoIVB peptidase [Oscillospiraceae bacterium]
MKKMIKILTGILAIFCAAIMSLTVYGNKTLPDNYSLAYGELDLGMFFNADKSLKNTVDVFSGEAGGESNVYDVKLLNIFPVKSVNVNISDRKYLAVGGELIGIKLKTEGVLVVGTESFQCDNGQKVCPATDAGIKKGDTITSINGTKITDSEALTNVIENSAGKTATVIIKRGEDEITLYMTPKKTAATGLYKSGLWVRDSTVGVGTLTFSDIDSNKIAALGHGIYDSDTSSILSVSQGEIYTASVSSVKKGFSGSPGEITGRIGMNTLGSITLNREEGIFGDLYYIEGEPEIYPMATISEVHTGEAQVLCTVTDGNKQFYDIEISKINVNSDTDKNMTVKITDQTLLALTGGIVQGMSGSPIIQDGYIIGAITHVFINDPKSGYAIFAENMLKAEQ